MARVVRQYNPFHCDQFAVFADQTAVSTVAERQYDRAVGTFTPVIAWHRVYKRTSFFSIATDTLNTLPREVPRLCLSTHRVNYLHVHSLS